jgi:aminomethyltransferase
VDQAKLRTSPLDAEHRALDARLTEFGGWDMPIQYRSVLEEHRACREHAVVFDVSHLGSVRVTGPGAVPVLQWALTNDLGRIEPGRAQYTHLLDPEDAHVVDDIIVWWVDPDELLVMPNASNTEPIVSTLVAASASHGDGCEIVDITETRAVLAVQGPEARALLRGVAPEMADVPRFAVARVEWRGTPCVVAGTGYTGEDGVEIHVPAEQAPALWREIVGAGVVPAGLGARDTLRLEAGLPLHGHELGAGITPLQAGLAWVVRFDKGDFRGREPLLAERERGLARRLRGLLVEGRRPPRAGYPVVGEGNAGQIGEVTSGNFSPTLERAIALAFLPPGIEDGAAVSVDMRGTLVPATVVKPPFVKP